jgi:hypothetical protein
LGDFIIPGQQQQQQQRNYMPQQQRMYRNEYETGARRKEYFQQRQQQPVPNLSGPTLLAPIQQSNANYIPVQHNRQQQQQQNYGGWQQREQPFQNQYQQPQTIQGGNGNRLGNAPGQHTLNGPNSGNSNGGSGINGGNNGGNYGGNGSASNSTGPLQYGPSCNGGQGENGYSRQDGAVYNGGGGVNGPMNVQLSRRGGPNNNDSGYTEPNWQEQGRGTDGGEWQGNTYQRIPDRPTTTAADTYGNMDGTRPRLNSKRGRDGPDNPTEDGPPRAKPRQ